MTISGPFLNLTRQENAYLDIGGQSRLNTSGSSEGYMDFLWHSALFSLFVITGISTSLSQLWQAGFPQSLKVRESHGKLFGHGKSWKSHGK